jgi:hypothetical protein
MSVVVSPALEFRTVPEELLGVASAAGKWLSSRGYSVTPEQGETAYPFTPTLYGTRKQTTGIVEVDDQAYLDNMREWVAFGRSRTSDTRVWCAIGEDASHSARTDARLSELGVGLLLITDGKAQEAIAARDLAVNLELPNIESLSSSLQAALGPVYEHFDRSEWRECFEEACHALEEAARRHLWDGIQAGRILVLTKAGQPEKLTEAKIDKMTMGALSFRFEQILQQSRSDRIIGDALKEIKPHRNRVVHHKTKTSTEESLRREVGSKIWLIFGALKKIEVAP